MDLFFFLLSTRYYVSLSTIAFSFFQRDDQVLGIGLLIRTLVWELFKDWDLFGLEELGWNDFLNKLRETDCRFEDSRSSDSYNRGLDASAIPSEYTVS